ncbi:MAG: hypothetical protein A2265_06160 [Bacteroidetes bacterium RIFOXYA12_FULL_33_9]|nr:MAG: hypothetical protein A2265_06160 [Bacteroidetes bacterium RIFOXYA12_FULL_33_9]
MSQTWQQTYGGASVERATNILNAGVANPMAKQSFLSQNIICGYTESFGNGGSDMYLINIDEFGDTVWTSVFGTSENDFANSIYAYNMGYNFNGYSGIVAGSSFNGTDKDGNFYYVDENGGAYPGIIFDNGFGDDEIFKMKTVDGDSYNMFAVGYQTNEFNNKDLLLLKYSEVYMSDLEYSDSYVLSGSGDDVAKTFDGDYNKLCIVGYTTSNTGGDKDIFITYFDLMQYQFTDSIFIGGEGDDEANVISAIPYSGEYIVAGYTTALGLVGKQAFIAKIDGYGDTLWTKTFGWDGDDEILSISLGGDMYDVKYIISGYTYRYGDKDILIAEINGNTGDTLWTDIVGEIGVDEEATGVIHYGCSYTLTGTKGNDIFAMNRNVPAFPLDIIVSEPYCYGEENGEMIPGAQIPGNFWTSLDYDLLDSTLSSPYVYGTTTNSYGANTDIYGNISAGTYYLTITNSDTYCEVYDTIIVGQPDSLSYVKDLRLGCYGESNKTLNVSISGGIHPYYIDFYPNVRENINSSRTSDTLFTGLSAMPYFLTINDNNGCGINGGEGEEIIIGEPEQFYISVYSENTICYGANDGKLFVEPTGGNAPYSYIWDDELTQIGDTAFNLSAGYYSVTATDYNGCVRENVGEISEYGEFIIYESVSDATCFGESNGSAYLSVEGSTGEGYSYLWSTSDVYDYIENVPAGNYSVVISDYAGCDTTYSLTINQPDDISITETLSNVSCSGMTDGSIYISTVGGTAPYTYSWSNGATTQNISALTHGTYGLTLTDSQSCQKILSYTILQPSKINVLSTVIDEICSNSFGSISTSIFGGTSPYSYAWSNGETTNDINSLVAGTYGFTVTDANNCNEDTIITLSSIQTTINLVSTVTNETCNNSLGEISLSVFGGSLPYVYNWTNSQTTATNSGLNAGVYGVTVSDANNCTVDTFFSITNYPTPSLSLINSFDILCYGNNTGSISVIGTGGTGSLNYFWSNGGVGTNQSSLAAGDYNITVIDAMGCRDTFNTTLTQPSNLVINPLTISNASCFGGNNGSISASAIGGVSPYSFEWSNGASTNSINSLSAGSYSVIVSDANNCTKTTSGNVSEPTAIILSNSIINTSCGLSNGSAIVTATGGTSPYTYLWTDGQTTASASNLASGNYSVTVIDAMGCTENQTITIGDDGFPILSLASSSLTSCFGVADGSASVSATGGISPYSYLWPNSTTTSSVSGLAAGDYIATVTDENGCIDELTITISDPEILQSTIESSIASCIGGEGSAIVTTMGGTSPYSYTWSNGQTTELLEDVSGGTYFVSIFDANNCQIIDTVLVESKALAIIQGVLSDGNGALNANATEVKLYKHSANSIIDFELVTSAINTENGAFELLNIPVGIYYLKAQIIDDVTYPNLLSTYYESAYKWFNAEQIHVGCDTTAIITLSMLEITPPAIGTGTISGIITWASLNKSILGEPVPGAEITLEQEPDDEPMAEVLTDVSGQYEFDEVPDGIYSLSVDVPGLPQFETHTISVSSVDTLFSGMNFIVDTTIMLSGIYIDESSSLTIYENDNVSLNVYPNPFAQEINIEYNLTKSADVTINLFDVSGRLIERLVNNQTQNMGKHVIEIEKAGTELKQGIYFIEFNIDNLIYLKKIIKSS